MIKDYIKAITLQKEGKTEEAKDCLKKAIGIEELTPMMEQAMEKLLDGHNPNDAIIVLSEYEEKKK